jgi:CubicO group peptidase (beta-lactamase class C family)
MVTEIHTGAAAGRRDSAAKETRGTPALDIHQAVNEIANRWPSVGLAVGVIRDGRLDAFSARGLADIASATPVTEDTVFRIASVTKTFTAIAVMQLWEQGSVDLGEPANAYLRAYRLLPARTGFRQPTVRHLLTHTAGIREVLHPSGLLRMRDLGETVKVGQPVPSLAKFYRGALRYDADPGTTFCYTDHGFATLGQIVEDITGMSLGEYLRAHIFEPLGMEQTDLLRSERVGSRLATGYELRSGGTEAVSDYELITAGGGGIYSTPRDMARYVAVLLGGGGNEHGSVLKPETLATMFEPHFQPDPRVPGFGLGFFRTQVGGDLALEHDGILPGFDSQILLAPNDGVGVMAFANGAKRGMHWLGPESRRLLRQVLDVPDDAIRSDVPQHPEVWDELCGWYRSSAMGSDPARFALGPGVEVVVRRGDLMIRALSPIPALRRGFVLHPDDPDDPHVFRIEFPWFGLGTCRVVFAAAPGEEATTINLDMAPISFERRSARTNPRIWVTGAILGGGAATAATVLARRLIRREKATS